MQRLIPAESLSRVASYDWFGSFAFYPIGLAVWGPVAGVIGVSTALWIALGLCVAVIAALLAARHSSAEGRIRANGGLGRGDEGGEGQ